MWNFICEDMEKARNAIMKSDATKVEKKVAEQVYTIFRSKVNYNESCYSLSRWWNSEAKDVKHMKQLLKNFLVSKPAKEFRNVVEFCCEKGPNFYTDD